MGLRVDATSPWVDARLPDGSRVQANFLSDPFRDEVQGRPRLTSGRSHPVHHAVEPPADGDALQLVLAGVLEDESGAGGQSLTVEFGEDLRCAGQRTDPGADDFSVFTFEGRRIVTWPITCRWTRPRRLWTVPRETEDVGRRFGRQPPRTSVLPVGMATAALGIPRERIVNYRRSGSFGRGSPIRHELTMARRVCLPMGSERIAPIETYPHLTSTVRVSHALRPDGALSCEEKRVLPKGGGQDAKGALIGCGHHTRDRTIADRRCESAGSVLGWGAGRR